MINFRYFKAYIRQLYLQGLIILVKKLTNGTSKNPSIYKSLVLTSLGDDLKSAFVDGFTKNKENLNLLVACLNSHTDETVSFLKSSSLKPKNLFPSTNSFDSIYDILSQSSESLPCLQPICVEIITYLMKHQTGYFNQFWPNVVDARLAGKKEPEKKLLAVKFFILALSHATEDTYPTLIGSSEQVLKAFVSNYVNRQSNLSELMRNEVSKSLLECVREKDGVITMGADLMIKLISHTRNCHEMSDLIGSLIHVVKQPSLNKLFGYFTVDLLQIDQEHVVDETTTSDEAELIREQISSKQIWMLTQLSAMARNRSNTTDQHDFEIVEKILGYLLANAYFETNDKLSAKAVESARTRLVELIGVLLSTPTTSRLRQIVKSVDRFEKLFKTNKLNEK